MKLRSILLLAGATVFAGAGRSSGQSLVPVERDVTKAGVPKAFVPPPGMCRVWLDYVPPAMQPPPTDCATAIRSRPRNGRVVFGETDKGKAPKDSVKAAPRRKKA